MKMFTCTKQQTLSQNIENKILNLKHLMTCVCCLTFVSTIVLHAVHVYFHAEPQELSLTL